MKFVPSFLKNAFFGISAPTPEENRLFAAVSALPALKKTLEERMLPMLEADAFLQMNLSKDKTKGWDVQEEDTTTWSFYLLLQNELRQKGWKTYSPPPERDQDIVLCDALNILTVQSQGITGRLNFDMVLAGYKKDEHAPAMKFLCEHVGDLETTIADLQKFTPGQLEDKHKTTFPGLKSQAARAQKAAPAQP